MNNDLSREPRRESLVETGEAIVPLPRPPSGRHQVLRAEAHRRRTTARILVVCSSVVAVSIASLCYALLF